MPSNVPLTASRLSWAGRTGGEPTWKGLVEAKVAELRARIEHLTEIQAGLEHALRCPSENVLRCEHFRAALADVVPVTKMDRPRRNSPVA